MSLFDRYPILINCREDYKSALDLLIQAFENDQKLLICGNGGSASDSDHIAGELQKGFNLKREIEESFRQKLRNDFGGAGLHLANNLQQGLPAISITSSNSVMTATINDTSPDMVFAQQVFALGRKDDVLIGISTSGNSINVVNALRLAKSMGMKTIGLTGRDGGVIKEVADISIIAPAEKVYEIQELHLPIYHALCMDLENYFYGDKGSALFHLGGH